MSANDNTPRRCDGETVFGFTVKACSEPATRLNVRNGTHEYYDFCDRHHYFFYHSCYPEQIAEKTNGESDIDDGR